MSQSPAEYTAPEQIAADAYVLAGTLRSLAYGVRTSLTQAEKHLRRPAMEAMNDKIRDLWKGVQMSDVASIGADPALRRAILDVAGPAPALARDAHGGGEERMLLDGQLVHGSSAATFSNVDPATGEELGRVADATADDLERAIAAARRSFDETDWRHDGAFRRHCLEQLSDAMREELDVLRAAVVAELGSPVRLAANVQVDPVIDKIAHMATFAEAWTSPTTLPDTVAGRFRHHRQILREPIGVVGAVTPWNIPLDLPSAKIAGVLAAGNTLVLKPAPDTPWVGNLVGRLIAERTDIPAGVVNIVTSSDHALGAMLTADRRVDAISFTGSTATGRKVMAAAAEEIKRVHLELGGKNPNLILDDADLEMTVPIAAALACFNAGQSCILPSRLLVPLERLDACIELAAAGLASVPVGDPWDPGTFMGPLVSRAHHERVSTMLKDGLQHSGRVVFQGEIPLGREDRYFPATLVADLPPEAPLIQEELFGPILAVQAYRDEEEAIRLANGTGFGLAGYIWSTDEERARRVAGRLRVGMIGINGGSFTGGDMPFGGVGHSGLGREWGQAGVEEFLDIKTISSAAPA